MAADAPRAGSMSVGWARLGAAALLGAVGVAAWLLEPDLWAENPDYQSRVSLGRLGWLVASCLAAAVVRSDWRGFVAAWLGALAALPLVVPARLSHSLTTAGDPFWIGVSAVTMAVYVLGLLALAFGAMRLLGAAVSPQRARPILGAVAAVVFVVSVGLIAAPPGPNTGPQPAPTYPG